MLSAFFRSTASRRTSTSLAGALVFSISSRPATAASSTMMEAPPPTPRETSSYSFKDKDNTNSKRKDVHCHYQGRIFYPQDIYYDKNVKEALTKLRKVKRTESLENQKELELLEASGSPQAATLTLIGYKGGTLDSQINQDRAVVISPYQVGNEGGDAAGTKKRRRFTAFAASRQQDEDDESSSTTTTTPSRLIAVFDGHARLGEKVSQYAVTELPNVLAKKLDALNPKDNPDAVKEALIDTFIEIDRSCPGEVSGGCTASVILQRGSKVFVANAGDSRSFLVVYRPSSQTVEIIYISREDKPHLPDERKRVEECGGQVFLPPLGISRVLFTDPDSGMQSGLAMSRSIGDWAVGKLGVIPDPIVEVIDVDQVVENQVLRDCQIPDEDGTMDAACFISSDDVHIFAVAATDGLMDFASPEVIAQAVASSLYHDDAPYLLSALEQLIYLAASGWEKAKQGRYRDDIAISVTEIRKPPMSSKQ
ncbi:protein phosphatase 2C [Nitzschia inconspicua]|uniref:Protein phosphatase 2C n=1 Tax=Nitzschia inconspicua TaxID=303405 RepID=A0A9K3LS15_9STRA|nr:protein phosphatase 2C [Nitzschia inconspicua]